jgi:peptidoglycan hydrolase CwlO-like protein
LFCFVNAPSAILQGGTYRMKKQNALEDTSKRIDDLTKNIKELNNNIKEYLDKIDEEENKPEKDQKKESIYRWSKQIEDWRETIKEWRETIKGWNRQAAALTAALEEDTLRRKLGGLSLEPRLLGMRRYVF